MIIWHAKIGRLRGLCHPVNTTPIRSVERNSGIPSGHALPPCWVVSIYFYVLQTGSCYPRSYIYIKPFPYRTSLLKNSASLLVTIHSSSRAGSASCEKCSRTALVCQHLIAFGYDRSGAHFYVCPPIWLYGPLCLDLYDLITICYSPVYAERSLSLVTN